MGGAEDVSGRGRRRKDESLEKTTQITGAQVSHDQRASARLEEWGEKGRTQQAQNTVNGLAEGGVHRGTEGGRQMCGHALAGNSGHVASETQEGRGTRQMYEGQALAQGLRGSSETSNCHQRPRREGEDQDGDRRPSIPKQKS